MMALARLLATLARRGRATSRSRASRAVNGTAQGSAPKTSVSSADLLDGRPTSSGTGPIGVATVGQPSINAIGLDMTSIAGSSNVLIPEARAKISMRIVPGSDPETELDALVSAPGGARARGAPRSRCKRTKAAPPFRCKTDGPGYAAAREALEDAFGGPSGDAG